MNLSTLYTYGEFGVLTAAWLPVAAAVRGLTAGDRSHRFPGHALRTLARTVTRASRMWDFRVAGTMPQHPGPFVVVSNHASLADPFLLSFLPLDMRFVAKESLFRAPLVGWHLKLAGDIPLRRGDRASAAAMHAACLDTLERDVSVMLFPEGTRSTTGELGAFRDGAFRIAAAARVPILPVALHGTAACIGPAGPQRARATAELLAPIRPTGQSPEALADLRDHTRAAIAAALATPR